MEFEWDDAKNRSNLKKHGISFEEAILIFDGLILTYPDDRFEYGEERWLSIGKIEDTLVVVVIHTDRAGVVRIISARPAKQRERKLYDAHQRTST